jgi:uridine kinase
VSPELRVAVDVIIAEIRRRTELGLRPLVVAIDGRSGSGKSTVASFVASVLGATVVPSDDFFAAGISAAAWDARTPAQRAADAIDWRRLRTEALEPLRAGQPARWHAFDFSAGVRPDGTYAMQRDATVRPPAPIVLLDGAYSARPELTDLVDLAVLVEAPAPVRRARVAEREEPGFLAEWHTRWDEAEEHYFRQVRPRATFDVIVTTGSSSVPLPDISI